MKTAQTNDIDAVSLTPAQRKALTNIAEGLADWFGLSREETWHAPGIHVMQSLGADGLGYVTVRDGRYLLTAEGAVALASQPEKAT